MSESKKMLETTATMLAQAAFEAWREVNPAEPKDRQEKLKDAGKFAGSLVQGAIQHLVTNTNCSSVQAACMLHQALEVAMLRAVLGDKQ